MPNALQSSWAEVAPTATKMFNVWTDGGELVWAKEAWGHLYVAGLAGQSSVLESTASRLRLVTLARIYQEFSGHAWEENPETPVCELAEDLAIDAVALGILAATGGSGQFDEALDDYELRETALLEATKNLRAEIFRCLKAAYGGETALYQRLWHTRSEGANTDGAEFAVTGSNSTALQFVTNGFQS